MGADECYEQQREALHNLRHKEGVGADKYDSNDKNFEGQSDERLHSNTKYFDDEQAIFDDDDHERLDLHLLHRQGRIKEIDDMDFQAEIQSFPEVQKENRSR